MGWAERAVEALRAGRAFLIDRQDADGLWRDFVTLAGESSDWVSGFVAYAAGALLVGHAADDGLARAVATATHELVRRQRPNGGWSFNRTVPTDADSTAWVLLALSDQPDWRPSSIARGRRYLRAHQDVTCGGFTTYAPNDGIHRYIGVPEEMAVGWRTPQPCVTAAAVRALLASPPRDPETVRQGCAHLLAAQSEDGLWWSYWWVGPAYPTYQALAALTSAGVPLARLRRSPLPALRGLAETAVGFDLAHVLHAVCLLDQDATSVDVAAQRIAGEQRGDGSWASPPFLRIPPPMHRDPAEVQEWRIAEMGTGVSLSDPGRLFSTAAALAALEAGRRALAATCWSGERVRRTAR